MPRALMAAAHAGQRDLVVSYLPQDFMLDES